MTSTNPSTNPSSSPSRGLLFQNTKIGFSGGKERTPILSDSDLTASIAFVGENDPGIPDYSYTLSWAGGILSDRTAWEWQESTDGTTWGASTSEAANATSATVYISFRNQIRYFRVREVSATENGPWSNVVQAWTQPTAPDTFSATAVSGTQIDLSWKDLSTNETGFVIERRTPAGSGSYSVLATVGPIASSGGTGTYSDTGLTTGQSYQYRVAAITPMVNSAYSAAASATTASTTVPSAPSGFTATSSFADSVSLSWTDNSSGSGQETGFDIEVSTNAGSTYSSVTTTAANAVSYSHTGRTESTAYLYRIRATNSAGSSSWVVASSVTTPAAVQSFTATAASSTQINLSWTDKSGVETGFRIERSTDNTNWSLVTTTAASATSFSNTSLNASTLYYYRIRSDSYNGTNNSAWYSASATTQSGTTTYNVEYLVIAGGGGGGGYGGGGAGGYKTASGLSLTPGNVYTVTVGGGAASTTAQQGNNGNDSSLSGTGISTITSTGGGGGGGLAGGTPWMPGKNGGSGGGGGVFNANNTAGGTGTSGEGNNGGAGQVNANYPGGGGGGADAVGGAGVLVGSTATGGAGGAGKASSITGTSVTRGGGGGGGTWQDQASGTGGVGGSGGGGNGGDDAGQPTNGGANTGGGGGGRGKGDTTGTPSAGGSGVVILRIPTANYSGTYTNATETTDGSFKVLTFNSCGSYTG